MPGVHVQFGLQKPQVPPTKAPSGEPESHSSPNSGSVMPLPHLHMQSLVQNPQFPPTKPPLAEPESHCSPGSLMSLPQTAPIVVVVVVVVAMLVDEVLVVTVVDVVLVDGLLVVVVGVAWSGAHSTETLRPLPNDLAHAAPVSVEAFPSERRACGAVMNARTLLPPPT